MKKTTVKIIKALLFLAVFHILCMAAAVFVRNDDESYARLLFKDFYSQDNIDVLFCGASHIPHGLDPFMVDSRLGVNSFCAGTSSQRIDATFAVMKEAASLYDIREIWLEMDFAVAQNMVISGKPDTSVFIVSSNLRNPMTRIRLMLRATSPKYYINSICPIGTESLVNVNPVKMAKRTVRKIRHAVRDDAYIGRNRTYGGKGLVIKEDAVENGTFTSGPETAITFSAGSNDYTRIIREMMDFCAAKGISLNFYCQPQSDFYLCEKGNYDEYTDEIRKIIEPARLVDFNLLDPLVYSPSDDEFYDDNHFNRKGSEHFSRIFCDYRQGKIQDSDFCASYREKLERQEPRSLGLMFTRSGDCDLAVSPVLNHGDPAGISCEIDFGKEGGEFRIEDGLIKVRYPPKSSGNMEIRVSYNGKQCNSVTRYYSAM